MIMIIIIDVRVSTGSPLRTFHLKKRKATGADLLLLLLLLLWLMLYLYLLMTVGDISLSNQWPDRAVRMQLAERCVRRRIKVVRESH